MSKKLTRRLLCQKAMAAGAAGLAVRTAAVSGLAMPTLIGRAHAAEPAMVEAALQGVTYFRSRNEKQIEMVDALRTAIGSGDLAAARQAYIDARPPYEEIETLAANFEESDSDIDARPYSFEGGETSEDFRGFHKIEYLLFRDDDLALAGQYADTLAASAQKLHQELGEPERYSPATHFEGMIGLAEEIGSKKISSEEETWSDQSMLIFRSNIIGIFSQYEPFAPQVAERDTNTDGTVREAYQAFRALLEPHEKGPGEALTPYSQVGIAERKAISDATYRFRDSLIAAADALGVFKG
ncbi:MAG: EfeM/EfeO family lipoprotein [Pseudomonadota bacterium]